MKFVELDKEYQFFKNEIDEKIKGVCSSGCYLFGSELETFENRFAKYIGVQNAVGVKNCTDAITLLVQHIIHEKGDVPIILPNFGAYPTAVACKNCSDNLFYVDVDDSFTMDFNKLPDVKNGIVILVHLFGNLGDERIKEYVSQNNHILIEDCAQSTGTSCGTWGDYSVFSFYPTKPLASMGDGGMICSNKDLSVFKKLRFYGQSEKGVEIVGVNSRLDEFQAGILNAKLDKFSILNDRRLKTALRYKKIIKGIRVITESVFHQFPVIYKNIDLIIKELKSREIPYMIHYPKHVCDMEPLKGKYNEVTYRVNDKIISLPVHPFMSENDIGKMEQFLYDFRQHEYTD